MQVPFVRQFLHRRQREPRRDDALDRGIVRQVEEQRRPLPRPPCSPRSRSGDDGKVLLADVLGVLELEEAWQATWAATNVWGRPVAEKMGIFLPRAMGFMVWQRQRDVRHQAHNVHHRTPRQLRLRHDEPPRSADAAFQDLPQARRERILNRKWDGNRDYLLDYILCL